MDVATIIKIILMLVFFSEVMVFGKLISGMRCFKQGSIMSIAMTFSGTLFLSIALLDIIPQAIHNFDVYFDKDKNHEPMTSNLHTNSNLPLTMIIASFTFLIIMYIDKILIGHSHDHQYQVSFTSNPKLSAHHHDSKHKNNQEQQQQPQQINNQQGSNKQNQDIHQSTALSLRPFILQAGMSIHAFFQCLAVGLQKTPIGILGLASAIIVHKWAQGLTLGLIYRKQNYSKTIQTGMILIQAIINVSGLVVGTIIIDQGSFVMAFFMSISAGTFLYISLAEVLTEQISQMNRKKAIAMISANVFLTLLVLFQKAQEKLANDE